MNNPPKPNQITKSNSQGSKQEPGETWISPSQVNNPIWKFLKIQRKVKTDQVSDFISPDSHLSILFLSLSFHLQFPLYIHDKLDKYSQSEEFKTYPNHVLL